MKNVKSIFDSKQIEMLEEIGVELSDGKNYTADELDDIYDEITSFYQCAAFDKNGDPLPIAHKWERIIDTFFDDVINNACVKVKYVGPDIGVDGLKNNGIYEIVEVDELTGMLRIIDESGEDYLYSPNKPKAVADTYKGGKFEIISDIDGILKSVIKLI